MAPFDPLPSLHAWQHRRPVYMRDVDVQLLSPSHRILLSTDGTVTNLLEAIVLEPIEVKVLERALLDSSHLRAWLDTGGSQPLERHVALRGRCSGRLYAAATSLLSLSHMDPAMVDGLSARKGIGEALRSSRTESFRELLWYGLAATDRLLPPSIGALSRSCLSRAYRILSGGYPIMVIQESFPLNAFPESRYAGELSCV